MSVFAPIYKQEINTNEFNIYTLIQKNKLSGNYTNAPPVKEKLKFLLLTRRKFEDSFP